MVLYFANRSMDMYGFASLNSDNFTITDDKLVEDTSNGVATLEADILFTKENRQDVEEWTQAGNFILMSVDGTNAKLFTIVETTLDIIEQLITVYCEDAGLDLINEVLVAEEHTSAHTMTWYINRYISDSGFEIGRNDVSSTATRTLTFSEETLAARLLAIAREFSAELGFSYEIDTKRQLKISAKHLDIYSKRGEDNGVQLRLKRDINNIKVNTNIENVATAMRPVGNDLTLKGTEYSYDNGDIYSPKNSEWMYCKSSNAIWRRKWAEGSGTGGWIQQSYSSESKTRNRMAAECADKLRRAKAAVITYEVDVADIDLDINIGDMVYIIDEEGELFLQSRILTLETSYSQRSKKITLGDYKIKQSGIREDIIRLAKQFVFNAIYSISIQSNTGIIFKGTNINTTLTAYVYNNKQLMAAEDLVEIGAVINWYVGNTLVATGETFTLNSDNETETITAKLEVM